MEGGRKSECGDGVGCFGVRCFCGLNSCLLESQLVILLADLSIKILGAKKLRLRGHTKVGHRCSHSAKVEVRGTVPVRSSVRIPSVTSAIPRERQKYSSRTFLTSVFDNAN